jgi:hypothetical protein
LLVCLSCAGCEDQPPPLEVTTGAASSGTGGDPDAGTGTKIVSRSEASDFERGPQIAVKGDVIGVVWTGGRDDGSPTHIGYTFSVDGGETWQPPGTIESSDDDEFIDPDLAVDNTGNFYLSWVAYSRVGKGGQIFAATATEASLVFSAKVAITDEMVTGYYERPRITVTETGVAFVAYTELLEGGVHGLAVASRAGSGWKRTSLGSSDSHTLLPYPCAPPQSSANMGRTWLTFQQNGRLWMSWTDDGGTTWGGAAQVNTEEENGSVQQVHSCAGNDDEVWVAYGIRSSSGLLQAIRIAYSSDGGQSFVQHVDAHDAASLRFAGPALALEAGPPRALHVAYYAGSGPGDTVAALRRARLELPADGGLPPPVDAGADAGTGMPSLLVHKPIVLDTSSTSAQWLGEYIGIASSSGKLLLAFVDNASTDRAHVAFERIDAP